MSNLGECTETLTLRVFRPAYACYEASSFLLAQPEPSGLGALKTELVRRWSKTGLLDVFKEAELRIGFTEAFATAASREATNRDEVRRRRLLCLYGLGTNAGLKRLAVGPYGFSHKELQHTWRRYIDAEWLCDEANATLTARNPRIWGDGTTACASDSKATGGKRAELPGSLLPAPRHPAAPATPAPAPPSRQAPPDSFACR